MILLHQIRTRLAADLLLMGLLAMTPVMLWLRPAPVGTLAALVDWKTVTALGGLMILSRGLEVSGAMDRAARAVIARLHSTRGLALLLVLFAACLSAVVTNDVALFVTVPLTLGLARRVALPVGRLVIFQALAVNAGSALSPVGNPQNLFLWQLSGLGFWEFGLAMLPLAAAMLALVLALIPLAFARGALALPQPLPPPQPVQRRLMWVSLVTYPLFLGAVNAGLAVAGAGLIVAAFALAFANVLRQVDWALLLVFVLMFVNLGLLGQVPAIASLVAGQMDGAASVLALGAGLSQIMSNVPATIFLAPFTEDWRALAWGVNLGGFGLAIGSLANLIALRLVPVPGIWRDFHIWSVPMLIASALAAAGLMVLLPA